MNEENIQLSMAKDKDRQKQLDDYKDSIVRLLQNIDFESVRNIAEDRPEQPKSISITII